MSTNQQYERERNRFDWDFQAADAFSHLVSLFDEHTLFKERVARLLCARPPELEELWCDPQNGLRSKEDGPSQLDFFLGASVSSGNMKDIEERFITSYSIVETILGPGHPWLSSVDETARVFGLRCT